MDKELKVKAVKLGAKIILKLTGLELLGDGGEFVYEMGKDYLPEISRNLIESTVDSTIDFFADEAGDFAKGFLTKGEKYVNFHLARGICKVWENALSESLPKNRAANSKYFLLPQDSFQDFNEQLEFFINKFKEAQKVGNEALLIELFYDRDKSEEGFYETFFAGVQNEKTAEEAYWTTLEKTLRRWSIAEGKFRYEWKDGFPSEFQTELKKFLFENLRIGLKEVFDKNEQFRNAFAFSAELLTIKLLQNLPEQIKEQIENAQSENRFNFSQLQERFSVIENNIEAISKAIQTEFSNSWNPKVFDDLLSESQKQTSLQEKILIATEKIAENQQTAPKINKIPTKLPVSRFPLRVQFFTGREDVLIAIEESLRTHKTAALYGIHGLGKSSVVTEFAYLNVKKYKHIFFIRAVGADFDIFIGEIVSDLKIPTDEQTTPAQKLQMFQRWLAENDDWLLILDNVDDVSAIKDHRFTAFGGDVVFTSNDDAVYQIGKRVEVPNMDAKEAASLLFQHWKGKSIKKFDKIPAEKRNALLKIAEMFGNSPLAMTFAGVYLAEEKESLDEFLENYHDKEQNLLEKNGFLLHYQHANVATPFLLAFEAISEKKKDNEREILIAEAVKDYLKISAFIAPDAIPEAFLSDCVKKLHPEHEEIFKDGKFFKEVRKRFKKSPIFKRDAETKTFSTHRIVQEVMRFKIYNESGSTQMNLCIQILNSFEEIFPTYEVENWKIIKKIFPHAEIVVSYAVKFSIISESLNKLVSKMGSYLDEIAQFEHSLFYHNLALSSCYELFGELSEKTATVHNNIAICCKSIGNYDDSLFHFKKALLIDMKALGKNSLNFASDLNNIGSVFHAKKEYRRTLYYCEKALQIRMSHPNIDPLIISQSKNNLAELNKLLGNLEKAKSLCLEALEIRLEKLGDDNLDTARCKNTLAGIFFSEREYEKARELYLEALQVRLNNYPKNHPDNANIYSNLGEIFNILAIIYSNDTYFDDSMSNYYNALKIRLNVFNEPHVDIAETYNFIGDLFFSKNELIKAFLFFERSYKNYKKALGNNHPETITLSNNLTNCHNLIAQLR